MSENQPDQEQSGPDFASSLETAAGALLEQYKRQLPGVVGQLRQERRAFQQQLVARWGSTFDLYDACYRFAFLMGNGINERHARRRKRDKTGCTRCWRGSSPGPA